MAVTQTAVPHPDRLPALRDATVVLVTGWVVFLLLAWSIQDAMATPVSHQLRLKSMLLVVSVLLIVIWRRWVPGRYGFEKAFGVPWRRVCTYGLGMGAAASLVLLLLGGRGMQGVIGSMKLWQIVLVVWIGSSLAEEVFTRGWAEGALERWTGERFGVFSVPVLTAAVLFGSMHLSLFRRVDPVTATVIVISTTGLGLYAGLVRERHKGLSPAIAAHVCFNIGGMLGGVVYAITYRLTTGRLPFQS